MLVTAAHYAFYIVCTTVSSSPSDLCLRNGACDAGFGCYA